MQHLRLIGNSICFIFIIFLLSGGYNFAFPLAIVVQGVGIPPYNKVFKGIKDSFDSNTQRIILYEYKKDIKKYVEKKRPQILFAIGEWALSELASIRDIPVIYLMVLNPDILIQGKKNFAGINMVVSAKTNLYYIKKFIPKVKCVGMIYDPRHSRNLFKELLAAGKNAHLCIVGKKVVTLKQAIKAIDWISDKIDVYIMAPDITVISPETLRFMNFFFLKKSIPIVTFSEKYLKMGAFMAIYPDPYKMGIQAGELAKKILKKEVKLPVKLKPNSKLIMINPHVAKDLGLKLESTSSIRMVVNE